MPDSTHWHGCSKAPEGWQALWVGPPGVALPTVPNFCPWCGERLTGHPNYVVQVTTGVSLASEIGL